MRQSWITGAWIAFVLCLPVESRATPAFGEFPQYQVHQGILDEDNFPVSGARLCTREMRPHCFALSTSGVGPASGSSDQYGLRAKSQRLKLDGGGSLILFNADTGGGSGSAMRYVLLRSDSDGRLKNLLPRVIVTNQSDVAAWSLPEISAVPIFVTADFIWSSMEGHYSSHFFEVKIYTYDEAVDRYKLQRKYKTEHEYPGVDNWEQAPEVLDKERNRIIELMMPH